MSEMEDSDSDLEDAKNAVLSMWSSGDGQLAPNSNSGVTTKPLAFSLRDKKKGAHAKVLILETSDDGYSSPEKNETRHSSSAFCMLDASPSRSFSSSTTPTKAAKATTRNGASARRFAIKKQRSGARAERERKIFRELNILSDRRKCPNFVRLEFDKDNDSDSPLSSSTSSRKRNGQSSEAIASDRDAAIFVLEYANNDLTYYKNALHPDAYCSILFQVLWALHIAQREFEFVHGDLHIRNILLTPLEEHDTMEYVLTEEAIRWYPRYFVVKITDFGLSRMRVQKEVLFNPSNGMGDLFQRHRDVEELFNEMKKLSVNHHGRSDEEKGRWQSDLRKLQNLAKKVSKTPLDLLKHSFFDRLKKPPLARAGSRVRQYSSIGSDEIADLLTDSTDSDMFSSQESHEEDADRGAEIKEEIRESDMPLEVEGKKEDDEDEVVANEVVTSLAQMPKTESVLMRTARSTNSRKTKNTTVKTSTAIKMEENEDEGHLSVVMGDDKEIARALSFADHAAPPSLSSSQSSLPSPLSRVPSSIPTASTAAAEHVSESRFFHHLAAGLAQLPRSRRKRRVERSVWPLQRSKRKKNSKDTSNIRDRSRPMRARFAKAEAKSKLRVLFENSDRIMEEEEEEEVEEEQQQEEEEEKKMEGKVKIENDEGKEEVEEDLHMEMWNSPLQNDNVIPDDNVLVISDDDVLAESDDDVIVSSGLSPSVPSMTPSSSEEESASESKGKKRQRQQNSISQKKRSSSLYDVYDDEDEEEDDNYDDSKERLVGRNGNQRGAAGGEYNGMAEDVSGRSSRSRRVKRREVEEEHLEEELEQDLRSKAEIQPQTQAQQQQIPFRRYPQRDGSGRRMDVRLRSDGKAFKVLSHFCVDNLRRR